MTVDIWAKLLIEDESGEINPRDRPVRLAITDPQNDMMIVDYSAPKICVRQLVNHLSKGLSSEGNKMVAEFQNSLLHHGEARLATIQIDDEIISAVAAQCK